MRTILVVLLLSTSLALGPANAQELAPWNSKRLSSDVTKRHVQQVVTGRFEYSVMQGGAMDGRNCRSPQGVWTPFEQTWESNRSVRLENVGQTDVLNPWLSNGRNNLRDMNEIVARAVEPGMSDKEKAMALWWQQIQFRFHYQGDNNELMSPVKLLNVYGHNTCGNDSICMAGLWKTAGLKVAPARLVGHCVTQVFYDGGWHLFDGDMHSMYLLRDNETIAGEQDLVRDHDLIKRTHTQGILRPQGRAGDEWESSIYVFEGNVNGDRNADVSPAMNMKLRPGEALVWRWGHTEPPKFFGSPQHQFVDRVCNGLWEYQPDLSQPTWQRGADSIVNVVSGRNGLQAEPGQTGEIAWTIRAPYVMVGGKLNAEGTGCEFELSFDGKKWESATSDLSAHFPAIGTARYSYQLRCRLPDGARLKTLKVVNDLQMAPLSLPEMGIGDNKFVYSDNSDGPRQVQITHEWVERSVSAPPAPPLMPIQPSDGGDFEGTDVAFKWDPAVDPNGEKIADYHFELSSRADMKWPLSMSFAKLVSRTRDAGTAGYTLKEPGELTPDREYYWRVRARNQSGVWGNWSDVWRFRCRGPVPPLNVSLKYDEKLNVGTLHWTPNSIGRMPVAYRVYASDEKGFSVSDKTFEVAAGVYDVHRKESNDSPARFPANFVAETRSMEMTVLGPTVAAQGANKSFYRVVAVDQAGKRSGPSEFVAAQRPMIYTQPVVQAKSGADYRYDVNVIRSIGDLRTRVIDGREVMKYWDVETPRFQIESGPEWLQIDKKSGRLWGKPDQAGRYEVTIAVVVEHELRKLDPAQLQWGIEKSTEARTAILGTARQSFTIEVQ